MALDSTSISVSPFSVWCRRRHTDFLAFSDPTTTRRGMFSYTNVLAHCLAGVSCSIRLNGVVHRIGSG